MNKSTWACLVALLCMGRAFPQTAPGKYWVQFTDKDHTPYTLDRPGEFLSQRALDRRAKYDISVVAEDLPVDPAYIDSLNRMGATVVNRSKWFNAVTIATDDSILLERVRQLGFVRQLKSVARFKVSGDVRDKFGLESFSPGREKSGVDTTLLRYGQATRQIGMLNGHILHNQGFQGKGMVIAILDAGFRNADINPAFDSLWMNHRILGQHDFVTGKDITFQEHSHGAQVLSVLAGNLPGLLVGSAPQASYYLLRTEDGNSEYPVEEDNWVSGAEYADSLGADMISSSLGYSVFDDPSMDLTYADMNGRTARISLAATKCCHRGMLVFNSAGNEGSNVWHYITAPGDADSIITVGACDSLGHYAYFSSTGPTADGRVKPDVAGQGYETAIVSTNGDVIRGSGTSFSCPLICGLTACLWEANPTLSPMEIIRIVRESATQANNPDSLLGYGLPDYGKALFRVQGVQPVKLDDESLFSIYPNPFSDRFTLEFYSHNKQDITVELIGQSGQRLYSRKCPVGFTSINRFVISPAGTLPAGTYYLRIITANARHQQKVVKVSH